MFDCAHCGIRQYAAASYVAEPRCGVCDAPLARPKAVSDKTRAPSSDARTDRRDDRLRAQPS
jgi:hypothetical protein